MISRAVKKLLAIKKDCGDIEFDVFLTKEDEVTLGFVNQNINDTEKDTKE